MAAQNIVYELDQRVRIAAEVARGGTLDGWKSVAADVVAIPAMPHLRLGLIAGFPGLLIDYLGLTSCGINFSGKTSIGKSTSQMLAVSAWTSPDASRNGSLMQSANSTLNNFEVMAARSNGTVLAIDELAIRSGRELQELVFRLAGNKGKGRLDRNAQARPAPNWHVFTVLSSEQGIESKIRSDPKAQFTAGTALRILDIGLDGHIAKVPKQMIDHIRRQAMTHYGHAGIVMAQALLRADRPGIAKALDATIVGVSRARGLGAEQRAAEVFGLLKLAGHIAVQLELFPRVIDVDATIDWAFDAFMDSSGRGLDPAGQAIETLELMVASEWNVTVVEKGILTPMRPAVAWYDDNAVYIPKESLSRLCKSELAAPTIAAELRRRGLLWVPKLEAGKNFTRRAPRKGTFYPLDRVTFVGSGGGGSTP